ncbi:UDP-2,4-diacetamido-2,4,6-trideoxy-beta-L-altropyranose hydrolase [Schinkia azotoformans]|uniref:UDP-2,4-diacetamido-2,4, 6-trideoxy-beta-L-altropyranose hydrolase n=1 Tax=Schinkia azotoformans TaxID=1454 RepID=UPI002DBC8ACF|nr:UDP-2,4-diacetamido-2,4,6-trideoxy-beta-L-altropyranose hydrolase [Schinkia azotoformans]MEC1715541.1 UDP-2,4-diacetamido-2,4,6-trideoxy-beta-L-altropyranose hydrolase [Schinkia azotoformans]MEC1743427.1 UDP-2,4-diacetamido-2,4,6-trideoxy-beta-L-altropyranose hydrolase [Schinkia azotoformans]MEC1747979.1 UDP-2,4-diacetamido-2,4,6-trideoxy-beta-L-altropyranose hydrolase [Schinkia azotoformans]MEC1758342.1 UDP-2,4-diacetamido-2,4,6-trideoxy-beta-L-altropyranose hydrolase [Schinkia azotoformans
MQILIRADASTEIGSGHIMRCLTLADMLRKEGATVYFVCRELKGHLCRLIEAKGYHCLRLSHLKPTFDQQKDAQETLCLLEFNGLKFDIVIIDHYLIDSLWEQAVRTAIPNIMVIDDLANRKHDCDILLDQNYFKSFEIRYDDLVPTGCNKLLGLKYLLLRPEFYEENTVNDKKCNPIQDLLIFYGGSDPTNETVKVLEALDQIKLTDLSIHIVVGLSNANLKLIENRCRDRNFHFYVQIDYLGQLMKKVDLALGAGGVTMWERCYLGLPSIITVVAENQKASTEAAAEYGAVWNLGWHENVKVSNLVDTINNAIKNPDALNDMAIKAKQLLESDVKYQTHPVVEAIINILR